MLPCLEDSRSPGRPGIRSHITEKLTRWLHARCPQEGEMDLLQQKRIRELPLFLAAKENRHMDIRNWLAQNSCDPFQRGAVGEMAVHVAALYNNFEAVCALLDGSPNIINEAMKSELYAGQTVLHIAVMKENLKLVKELVKRGADVSSLRATGTFFRRRLKNLFYFGEHVLCFAACLGHKHIVRFLIKNGADTKVQDSLGNTVLHLLVMQANQSISCQMYDLILSYDKAKKGTPLDNIINKDGLTPFKLAAIQGNTGMFQHMVEKRKRVQWLFGPITSNLYDLSGIDSWGDNQSVLELVTSLGSLEACRTLGLTPVKELVNQKWNMYKGSYFCASGISYVLYLICFTLCCVSRPLKLVTNFTDPNDPDLYTSMPLQEAYVTSQDYLRLVGELISVIGAVVILLLQLTDILHAGCRRFFRQIIWAEPFSIMIISFALLVLVILVMRVTNTDEERIPMSIALVLGWCYLMYFSRGLKLLGPFTIMIQKMAVGDLMRFCWLMAVVIFGYSTALYVAFQEVDPNALGAFGPYPMSFLSTYELFLNILNGPANYTIDVPFMYSPLYCSFCVVAFLLMFNLLIATLGNTHSSMGKEKESLWRAQIATAATLVEHRLPRRLWLRSGIPGKVYGLEDKWYINVEDRSDHIKQKVHQISDLEEEQPDASSPKQETSEQFCCQLSDSDLTSPVRYATLNPGMCVICTVEEDTERIYHV